MKTLIGILLITVILTSCGDNNIAAKLCRKCDLQNTRVRKVNEATDFRWDKVYIFQAGASLDEIQSVLGVAYDQWQDIGDRIIFVEKGKVIYHEDYFPFPEKIEKERTYFKLTQKYYIGDYNTATFSVTREENEDGKWYYSVTPIQ